VRITLSGPVWRVNEELFTGTLDSRAICLLETFKGEGYVGW
jgi:hypothetical protein